MDEARLKKALESLDAPSADENARKIAVNLAVAAFREQKQKSFQGIPFLSRLTGKSTPTDRRNTVEKFRHKKLVYGGMATALAVVLIAGVTVTQVRDFGSGASTKAPSDLELNREVGEQEAARLCWSPNGNCDRYAQKPPEAEQDEDVRFDDPTDAELAIRIKSAEAKYNRDNKYNEKPASLPEVAAALKKEDQGAGDAGKAASAVPEQEKVTQSGRIGNREQARVKVARGAMAQGTFVSSPPASAVADMIAPMPPPDDANGYYHDEGRDKFQEFKVNPVKVTQAEPVSTFSVDVDTASYSFVRRQLNNGQLPDKDAVRVEEMVNYFDYNYPGPESKSEPFKASVAITSSPWAEGKKLMHIGIRGYDITDARPHANLVFLIDVSGSMDSPDKLPLVKNSMKMLLDSLQPNDTVAITVYAGAAGTVLEPTKASERGAIMNAIDNLTPGGSTAGAAGINEAYRLAEKHFDKESVNRVILATDGDFNVGVSSDEELKTIIEKKRESGIFLSVLGFGEGNLNDSLMQTLAQNGNGVAAYIDTINEARKVLVEESSGTLFPIAKDVKIQVEFNPAQVAEYRLVGYETRHLNREDFNNDKIDAGDIGAGHTVTAIYEITPVGGPTSVDPLRYGAEKAEEHKADTNFGTEYAFLKIRYKLPDEDTSHLITTPISTETNGHQFDCPPCPPPAQCKPCGRIATDDQKFSVAVASFAQLLKGGEYTGKLTYDDVIAMAQTAKGEDPFGQRAEFINLARLAKTASNIQPQ